MTTAPVTIEKAVLGAAKRFQRARLQYGHGTTNALEDATFLVLETLGISALQPAKHWKKRLSKKEVSAIENVVNRRIRTRKPAAYLLKRAYIQEVPFYVDERVIVPRSYIGEIMFSETFPMLIENPDKIKSVLDLCTGSGCLALLAAQLFLKARVDAVDLSEKALQVAKINVQKSKFKKNVRLFQGDLFKPLKGKKYDLIITNPPYVTETSVRSFPAEFRHEPRMAHAGGDDGMDIVRRILKESRKYLNKGGILICEIGYGREIVEKEYPETPFLWLDTENSSGEVFFITREELKM